MLLCAQDMGEVSVLSRSCHSLWVLLGILTTVSFGSSRLCVPAMAFEDDIDPHSQEKRHMDRLTCATTAKTAACLF